MSDNFILIPGTIVTANENDDIFQGVGVKIVKGRFAEFVSKDRVKEFNGKVISKPDLVMIPGFVQTHIHLCQTLFRGLADDLELLDWLRERIFPYENSHSKESLRLSAQLGIHELTTSGTTTLLDMGTMRHEEVIFEELISSGIRAIAGKCMIDINDLYPEFKEDTKSSLKESYALAKEFHGVEKGRIKYGFAPRFVLSCSEELLKETSAMLDEFEGAIFHTHSSENKGEIEAVRAMTGKENIEYFESIGVLGNRTVLAHGIHVNEKEIEILKKSDARISHCPSSNLKLGSGIADIPRYISEGISVSLGADGAPCNNNLSAFTEMRLASLIQKPRYSPTVMNAKSVFKLATIEGAKALHIENETGSIEPGKKADFVLLDLKKSNQSLLINNENIYSNIVYSSGKENVKDVFVEGKQIVNDGVSLIYDEAEIVERGREELQKLIERTKI